MKDAKLPFGIRNHTLLDGSTKYEARINRHRVKMSQRFSTINEALNWKQRMDALIDSGLDPRTLEENKKSENILPIPVATSTSSAAALVDVAPSEQHNMTVEQAIDGFINHKQSTNKKLKANQLSEFQRVRNDLGNLKIQNLTNKDLVNYVTLLLKSPRLRDDPNCNRNQSAKPTPEGSLSAKALANKRYKERQKALKLPREPQFLKEATVRKCSMERTTRTQTYGR